MTAGEAAGWLTAALTLLTFSMRSLMALRVVAVAANVSFIAYGAMVSLAPVVVLNLLLVPCSLIWICQLFAESRSVRRNCRRQQPHHPQNRDELRQAFQWKRPHLGGRLCKALSRTRQQTIWAAAAWRPLFCESTLKLKPTCLLSNTAKPRRTTRRVRCNPAASASPRN